MRIILLVFFLWAGPASAQTFPEFNDPYLNDYAGILNPAQEDALIRQLGALAQETGMQVTVMTLNTQAEYAPDLTLEDFATRLYDQWLVEDAYQNDGVLILVIQYDRVLRLELGEAYARDWDGVAQRVVDEHFLPPLRQDDFAGGIQQGVNATIEQIVYPFFDGSDTSTRNWFDQNGTWVFFVGALGLIFWAARQRLGDFMARFRACPQCGQRGLGQTREVRFNATIDHAGSGILHTRCTACGYKNEAFYVIPQVTRGRNQSGGSGPSGGGGGGASGRF